MQRLFLPVVVVLLGILTACSNPASKSSQVGAVKLILKDNVHSRSLTPSISMTIASYDISGTGPDGSSVDIQDLSAESVGSNYLLMDLWPGSWSFTVNARNESSDIIGFWQGSGDIVVNTTQEVDVTIDPVVGQGDLEVTINLSAISAEASNLALSATLTPASGGEPISYSSNKFMVLAGDQRLLSVPVLANGYYTLMVFLASKDTPDTNINTIVESVRIVTGQTTYGIITYPSLSGSANLVLSVSALMANAPLTIDSFSFNDGETNTPYSPGAQVQMCSCSNFSVSAGVTDTLGGTASYQWFLVPYSLSSAVSSSASFTVNPEGGDVGTLSAGTYRLFLVVTDGPVVTSEHVDLTIQDLS